jgi:hypothetical protein
VDNGNSGFNAGDAVCGRLPPEPVMGRAKLPIAESVVGFQSSVKEVLFAGNSQLRTED